MVTTVEIRPKHSLNSGLGNDLPISPGKRACVDRTDQLPDTRRLHRNGVVGSTGRRIPTHSRRPITFLQYDLPAHGGALYVYYIFMTARDSRRIHNWCGSRKQLERERHFGKAIVSSSPNICQKSRWSGQNAFAHKSLKE